MLKYFLCVSLFVLPVMAEVNNAQLFEKLERMEYDLDLLQRRVYQSSGTGDAAFQGEGGYALDELYSKIDSQTTEISRLTDNIEKLDYELKLLKQKVAKSEADIDMRFQLAENKEKQKTKKGAEKKTTSKDSTTEQELYNQAYETMQEMNFEKAEGYFADFLKKYPKSKLAGNANYWLGETYYARGLYEESLTFFSAGVTEYKSNIKAADCLLKMGLTLKKMGRKKEACTAFKTLPTEFPKASSGIKERAREEAELYKCP